MTSSDLKTITYITVFLTSKIRQISEDYAHEHDNKHIQDANPVGVAAESPAIWHWQKRPSPCCQKAGYKIGAYVNA